jgi:hypothetical protein
MKNAIILTFSRIIDYRLIGLFSGNLKRSGAVVIRKDFDENNSALYAIRTKGHIFKYQFSRNNYRRKPFINNL